MLLKEEIGSWKRKQRAGGEGRLLHDEEGGMFLVVLGGERRLMEEEAYCWKWRLAHGR